MDVKVRPARSVPGTLHFIPPDLSAFEHVKPLTGTASTNTLLWIGGLMDTYLSVSYPMAIAEALGPSWSLVTASLSSTGLAFGVCSVAQDAEEMAKILGYFKGDRPKGKVIIMGHSTGCQDCVRYLMGSESTQRPKVDGIILQAPVSDREALELVLPRAHMQEANRTALDWCHKRQGDDVLPNRLTKPVFGKAALTAQRWVDIASPAPNHSGADDFFSSDLSAERLIASFGKAPAGIPWLFLYSGNDEYVPDFVDKHKLVLQWTKVVKEAGGVVDEVNGGIVPGATHNYNGCPEEVVQDLVTRVLRFVAAVK